MNTTITWEYAQKFDEQEKRWEEMEHNCHILCRIFAKNTFLQLMMHNQYMELLEITAAIGHGERGEYLYNKAKEFVDNTAKLEEIAQNISKLI